MVEHGAKGLALGVGGAAAAVARKVAIRGAASSAAGAARAGLSVGARLSVLAAAGLAAYWLTSKFLEARRAGRESRADQAFYAGEAFKSARREAEARLKRPLSIAEVRLVAKAFKDTLNELGFKSSSLGTDLTGL